MAECGRRSRGIAHAADAVRVSPAARSLKGKSALLTADRRGFCGKTFAHALSDCSKSGRLDPKWTVALQDDACGWDVV